MTNRKQSRCGVCEGFGGLSRKPPTVEKPRRPDCFRAEHVGWDECVSNKIVVMRHGCAQGSVSGEGSVSETSALPSSSSVFKASRVGTGSVSAQMIFDAQTVQTWQAWQQSRCVVPHSGHAQSALALVMECV